MPSCRSRQPDPGPTSDGWARIVAAVVAAVQPEVGFEGTIDTTLPVGAGLSSSAALEVALALALGFDGTALALAELGRRAEQAATGVPCGIMDQLASAAGVAGHVLRIDCHAATVEPVRPPRRARVVVAHSRGRALARRPRPTPSAWPRCGPRRPVVGPLRLGRASTTSRRWPTRCCAGGPGTS